MSRITPAVMIDAALQEMQRGAKAKAEALMRQVLQLEPKNPRALCVRAIIAAEFNQPSVASQYIDKALAVGWNMPAVLNNAATIAAKFGEMDRAMELWTRLHGLDPNFAPAWFNLAICHHRQGNLTAAVETQRKGLAIDPRAHWGYSNLGNYLKDAGKVSEAVAAFKEGISWNPGDINLHCNLAYAVHFDPACDSRAIYQVNREWAAKFTDPIPPPAGYANDRAPDRKLRVGYVSPNLRDHSESYFILPLFRGMDRDQFETIAYSTGREDAVTAEFKPHTTTWHHLPNATDDELFVRIQADEIDILVDFTQHMEGQRLMLFGRKPAPVQVSWLAYPSTTGLKQIDYTITDPWLESPDADCYSEKLWFLDKCYWCYEMIGPRPDTVELPAQGNGFITFGCLNHHGKVTPPVMRAWREILSGVPESRLVLMVTYDSIAEEIRAFFGEAGIAPGRIVCQGRLSREEYMRSYNLFDISLDPYPYNGATTTCDALWMGVPTVSWAGETAVSRAGLSIMNNIGLPDLVAFSSEEYIRKAIALAGDLPRLRDLRSTLRGTLESSVVMDAEYFGRAMGNAYREMWRRWCAHG